MNKRKLSEILIKFGKFIITFIVFLPVGFLSVFSINLINPTILLKQTGTKTTLTYSLTCLAFILITTALFIIISIYRKKKLLKKSWWLIGGYSGFITGSLFPVIYMIISATSSYVKPNNPYW